MKTMNYFLAVLILAMLSSNIFAKGDNDPNANISFDAGVQLTQGDNFIVRCINHQYDELCLKVYDCEGTLLHRKNISTKGNIKVTYNIREIHSGEFCVKIFSGKKEIYTEKFRKVNQDKITIEL